MENIETKNKLMDLYLENMAKSVELIDSVFIPTIKEFDGKVFNARLENTLKHKLESTEPKDNIYCSVELNYRTCKIDVHFYNNRSIQCLDRNGWVYLPDGLETINICSIYSEYNDWDTSKNGSFHHPEETHHFYIDSNYNTRICSGAIVNELENKKAYILQRIEKLGSKKTLQKNAERTEVEEWMKELEEIKHRAEFLNSSIPSEIRAIYELKTWANWY